MTELSALFWEHVRARQTAAAVELAVFALIVGGLVYGGVVYQMARLGCLRRHAAHAPVSREEIERFYDDESAPALTILVPSYKEETDVVRHTLLSAALQEYPHRRVVLLIDDPPAPANAADAAALVRMRRLPHEIENLLRPQAAKLAAGYRAFLKRWNTPGIVPHEEAEVLAHLYRETASWFDAQARGYPARDHAATLLVQRIFQTARAAHSQRAEELARAARSGDITEARILREFRRLNHLLHAELTSFERKRYVNLSHEANKAMNLNSYVGLMGRSFCEHHRPDGTHLERVTPAEATLHVPNTDFLITLDADSLVTTDYAARLIHHMLQPGNERVAVAQTPYSAIPGAPGVLERVAGATTDIQYNLHQGFGVYRATYWVGANALLRVAALWDIATDHVERGFRIKKFIQDRTVIEDTESSVDLIARGWRLYNYPERLAYSATPPDFGSLLIQRRRWANGGLIILPKILRYLRRSRSRTAAGEGFFRLHYLVSVAIASLGVLVLLAYPFGERVLSVWLPLTAAPYFFLYGRDLVQIGYRWTDLLRVYALNLLLIPVNLGGVLKSLQQAITKHKIAFGRTPKVANRTAVPAPYLIAAYTLLGYWLAAGTEAVHGRWMLVTFIAGNAAFLAYAIGTYIGWHESRMDLLADMGRRCGTAVPTGRLHAPPAGPNLHAAWHPVTVLPSPAPPPPASSDLDYPAIRAGN